MYIKNDCKNSPVGLQWHIHRSLSWINADDLQELDFIWLMDDLPEETEDEDAKSAKEGDCILYGAYKSKERGGQSYILLFTRYAYEGIPTMYWLTPIPTLRIVQTLAHEVAHHLMATRGYVFNQGERSQDKEALANQYATNVIQNMKKCWYFRMSEWRIKGLAQTHYILGIANWENQKYCAAADRWFKAWNLDPTLEKVSDWHWHAKELCSSNKTNSK